ncbi:MAG: ATPase, T2SS/T4P/T4SS family [Candidatus Altiarchaeota archaeon]|nr:ATPase, T2SS/T4P/T4SS family [Candidatus Altiarchaeota archaeon]
MEKDKEPKEGSDGEEMKLIEEYEITSDDVKTRIEIVEKEYIPFYKLIIPEVDVATKALLDDIKERLIGVVDMSVSDVLDSELMGELKKEFGKDANMLLTKELPKLNRVVKDHFILNLIHELLGLGDIEFLLDDENIEEVVINSTEEPVRIYHKKYGWLRTNITPDSEGQILNYANTIARRVGRNITTLTPLLDAPLVTGDRVNATLNPISTKGNTITIRKFARDPWTVTDFIQNKTVSSEILALIWIAIQYELNILISGGTGSGKTSFLNICMPFIPPNHRIISIEDTRELQLPKFLYWCPLTTREPNPEGKGEVTMLDLLINSLRMRPDRIIMGEIRKKREAEVLFEAMHTGHSVYSTLHADTCAQTITRLTNPPINIPESMLDSVHLNIVMFRDRKSGIRRAFEVGEFVPKYGGELKFKPNIIYRWDPKTDSMKAVTDDVALYGIIGSHTGFSVDDVKNEIEMKKKILEWLVKNNIRQAENVGKIMNRYYVDKETVLDVVNNDRSPKGLV